MKLILFAYHNWGVKTIKTIANTKHEIIHVFTHPHQFDPNEKVWFDDVSKECKKLGITVTEKISLTTEDIDFIKKLSPDLIFSVGWRKLLPKSIFTIPKLGTINMHESLLPKFKGFAPINWAIINGETETGITIHYIDETADTGSIILQKKISINPNQTAFEIFEKLQTLVDKLVHEVLNLIENNDVKPITQTKLGGFFCSRRFPEDGKIFWLESRRRIYNKIRALSDPYPNAFCYYKQRKIYIKKAQLLDEDFRGMPGTICGIRNDGVIITCGTDTEQNQGILITEILTEDGIKDPKLYFEKLWEKLD